MRKRVNISLSSFCNFTWNMANENTITVVKSLVDFQSSSEVPPRTEEQRGEGRKGGICSSSENCCKHCKGN